MSARKPTPHLDTFTRSYVETALWSSMDESDESGGEPMDANYGRDDIAPATMRAMERDCASFTERYGSLIDDDDSPAIRKHGAWDLAGHVFWLSRNGHGVSFLDGDWPKHGDELDKAAESYGDFELYVGDDGLIYAVGHENDGGGPQNGTQEARRGLPQAELEKLRSTLGTVAHNRAFSVRDLADYARMDPEKAARVVQTLLRRGLVERVERGRFSPTPAGWGWIERGESGAQERPMAPNEARRTPRLLGTGGQHAAGLREGAGYTVEARPKGGGHVQWQRGMLRPGEWLPAVAHDVVASTFDTRDEAEEALAELLGQPNASRVDFRVVEAGSAAGVREPRRHQVADFASLEALIAHARREGATHVRVAGWDTRVYYPHSRGYAEARVWRERGYWHSEAPSDRPVVDQLPKGAESIRSYLARSGMVAAPPPAAGDGLDEARRRRVAPARRAPRAEYPYERSPSDRYVLTRDGAEVARGTEQQVWAWMHGHLGYSISHALRHEGYTITPVEKAATMLEGPDPTGEWAVVQRMMKTYAQQAGLGEYVHNSALPTGRPGVWRFWAQRPGERAKEHEVTMDTLNRTYNRRGISESGVVRDYEATDLHGRRIAGPSKNYDAMKREADRAGGVVKFVFEGRRAPELPSAGAPHHHHRRRLHAEAARRRTPPRDTRPDTPHARRRQTPDPRAPASVVAVATELSRRLKGTAPKYVGPHRWSERNESATFVVHSPEHSQPVVVLVSVFDAGDLAIDFFSSESRSELDRYENIGNFLYPTADYRRMVADVQWVLKTVDDYAASWGAGDDREVDEARKPGGTRVSPTSMGWYVERPLAGGTALPLAGPYGTRGEAARKRDELARRGHGGGRRRPGRVSAGRSRLHPGQPHASPRVEAARRKPRSTSAEAAGKRYAQEQLNSDYFRDWVWEQMVQGERMRTQDPNSVIPLETAADFKRLARNMLQQLGWDIDRELDARDVLDRDATDADVKEFFRGLHEELRKPNVVDWLASLAKDDKAQLDEQSPRASERHHLRAKSTAPSYPGITFVRDRETDAAFVSDAAVPRALAQAAVAALRAQGWTASAAIDRDDRSREWVYVGWAGQSHPSEARRPLLLPPAGPR